MTDLEAEFDDQDRPISSRTSIARFRTSDPGKTSHSMGRLHFDLVEGFELYSDVIGNEVLVVSGVEIVPRHF